MDELNEELKTQREALGLSIQDLFRRTRINTDFLEALEAGNYDVLPEAYVKLFLKRYAQEVKLDGGDIVRKFEKLQWAAKASKGVVSPRGPEGTPGWVVGVGAALALGLVAGVVVLYSDPSPPPAAQTTATDKGPTNSRPVIREAPLLAQAVSPPARQPEAGASTPSLASVTTEGARQAGASALGQDSADKRPGGSPSKENTLPETPSESPEQILTEHPVLPDLQTERVTETPAELEPTVNPAAEEDTANNTAEDRQGEYQGERILSAYSLNLRQDLVAISEGLSLSVVGREATRVTVISDGKPIFDGLVDAGRKESWKARDRFQVEIQKGSSVRLELQDEPLPEVGAGGHKVRLFISRSSIWVEEIEPADLASSTSSTP